MFHVEHRVLWVWQIFERDKFNIRCDRRRGRACRMRGSPGLLAYGGKDASDYDEHIDHSPDVV